MTTSATTPTSSAISTPAPTRLDGLVSVEQLQALLPS